MNLCYRSFTTSCGWKNSNGYYRSFIIQYSSFAVFVRGEYFLFGLVSLGVGELGEE